MKKEKITRSDILRVELFLNKLNPPSFNQDGRLRMKNSLMGKINCVEAVEYASVVTYVRRLVNQIVLTVPARVRMKEIVFERMENLQQKTFFWQRAFVFSRKFASAALVFVMVLGMFSVFSVRTMMVRADTFTKLDYFSSDVVIEREGQKVEPYNGMVLYEGDKIITGKDGMAVVKYFDDSVTRLSSNTELKIDKLANPDSGKAQSYIEVSLNNGTLWSRVFNLVGRDSFFVVKANNVYAKAKKAAFNVEVGEDKTEVEVYSNVVDVKQPTEDKSEKVVSGKKVTVVSDNQTAQVKDLGKDEKEMAWVQENLTSDKKDVQEVADRIMEAKKESIGVSDANNINFDTSLQEKALVFLTFDDIEKKKIELDLAEKKFVGAEIKMRESFLTNVERQEVNVVLKDFSAKVKDFYQSVDEVKQADPEYAKELKSYVDDKLLTLKKELGISSQKVSFELKGIVDDLIVFGAANPQEVAEIKLDQTFDGLADVSDVAETGDQKLADDLLVKNKENATEAVDNIEKIDDSNVKEKAALAGKASEYFQVLDSMEGVKKDEQMVGLEQKVDEIKKDTQVTAGQKGDSATTDAAVAAPVQPVTPEQPYGVNIEGDKPLPMGL